MNDIDFIYEHQRDFLNTFASYTDWELFSVVDVEDGFTFTSVDHDGCHVVGLCLRDNFDDWREQVENECTI